MTDSARDELVKLRNENHQLHIALAAEREACQAAYDALREATDELEVENRQWEAGHKLEEAQKLSQLESLVQRFRKGLNDISHALIGRAGCKDMPGVIKEILEERAEAQRIVAELPRDAENNIIKDGELYWTPCANGIIAVYAYLGPHMEEAAPPYPWKTMYKSRKSALLASMRAQDERRKGHSNS